jgi:hypothetical protein
MMIGMSFDNENAWGDYDEILGSRKRGKSVVKAEKVGSWDRGHQMAEKMKDPARMEIQEKILPMLDKLVDEGFMDNELVDNLLISLQTEWVNSRDENLSSDESRENRRKAAECG